MMAVGTCSYTPPRSSARVSRRCERARRFPLIRKPTRDPARSQSADLRSSKRVVVGNGEQLSIPSPLLRAAVTCCDIEKVHAHLHLQVRRQSRIASVLG